MARNRVGGEDAGEGPSHRNSNKRRRPRPKNPVEAHPEDHPDLPEPIPLNYDDDDDEEYEDYNDDTANIAGQNGGNASAMATPMLLSDSDALDCHLCRRRFALPVFQCINGHTACSTCCSKLENQCPNCKLPIGRIRCRAVERVIESVEVPCKNATYGCKETLGLKEKKQHETTCIYTPCVCPHPTCNFVAASKVLCFHFRREHNGSAHLFEYSHAYSSIVLEPDQTSKVLQERSDGDLFIVGRKMVEQVGNLVNITWIGPNIANPVFKYGIYAASGEKATILESRPGSIQGPNGGTPFSESLLVPLSFFSLSDPLKLQVRIFRYV